MVANYAAYVRHNPPHCNQFRLYGEYQATMSYPLSSVCSMFVLGLPGMQHALKEAPAWQKPPLLMTRT